MLLVGGLCGAAIIGSGCVTTTSFSSPVALDPGTFGWTIGGTSYVGADGPAMPVIGLRAGVFPRFDIGVFEEALTTRVDARYQALSTKVGMPLDLDFELGLGVLFGIFPFTYAGVGVGRDFESVAPYVRYRHAALEFDEKKQGEAADDSGTDFVGDFLLDIWWAQLTVGAELKLSPYLTIIPEYSFILGIEHKDEGTFSSLSVAIRF
jgi:hypothetical protein